MTVVSKRFLHRLPGAAALALLAAACATYSPLPLPRAADLAASAGKPGTPPLDMNAVATLAVLSNPDLRASRARLHVAEAQAFAAGLLPDPQASWSSDHPTDHPGSGDPRYPEYNAYSFGLSLDLQALLTHSSAHAAADAAYEQARLDLLWQEWQTVAQARGLYVESLLAAQRQQFLERAEATFATQSARSQHALEHGDAALDQAGGDLAVLNDIRTQRGAAARAALQADQALHGLLGVQPGVPIPLQPLTAPELPERATIEAALARAPQVRPDLQALQAGYRSEEALLRKAVLAQFPNVTVGGTRARDASDVHSLGIAVSMNLPLFDRGRSDIALQRATREQLRAEYQARLDQTVLDGWQLRARIEEVTAERRDLEERLPALERAVEGAHRAYDAGDLAASAYLTLLNSYLTARASDFELTQSLWGDSISLATVLGTQIQPPSVSR